MLEECANILKINVPNNIHEKDDYSLDKIILPNICDIKDNAYIQLKYLEVF
jgi:hypothetical protein